MYHKIGIIFATLLLAVATLAKAQNNSTLSYIVQYNHHISDGKNAPYWFVKNTLSAIGQYYIQDTDHWQGEPYNVVQRLHLLFA